MGEGVLEPSDVSTSWVANEEHAMRAQKNRKLRPQSASRAKGNQESVLCREIRGELFVDLQGFVLITY